MLNKTKKKIIEYKNNRCKTDINFQLIRKTKVELIKHLKEHQKLLQRKKF